jgi:hypothetical protein
MYTHSYNRSNKEAYMYKYASVGVRIAILGFSIFLVY